VDGEHLRYDKRKTRDKGGELRPSPGMLSGFVALADADPQAIVDYAAEFGVLGVCAHGDIYTACSRDPDTGEVLAAFMDNPAEREPFDTWRHYSRLAGAILDLGQRLRGPHARRVVADELAPLVQYGGHHMFPSVAIAGTVTGARSAVARSLTRWLHDGDASLRVRWDQGAATPELQIGGDAPDAGLFTALGLQLAMACTAAEGLWRCSYCGRLHERARPPRPDQNVFCEECRRAGVPVRLANRARRARLKGEQS
jgi:hypothetical protein